MFYTEQRNPNFKLRIAWVHADPMESPVNRRRLNLRSCFRNGKDTPDSADRDVRLASRTAARKETSQLRLRLRTAPLSLNRRR